MGPETLFVLDELVKRLDELGIPYFVGGSVASSSYGLSRMTNDVDVVISLQDSQVEALAASLSEGFYADADMIHDAIRTKSSFNVIHLSTLVKADLFLPEETPFIQSEWTRRRLRQVRPGGGKKPVYVASPEDLVLQKLLWYRMTGERSDRQWADVQGILKVQVRSLDYPYLIQWAEQMALSDLLQQSLEDAGIQVTKPGDNPA